MAKPRVMIVEDEYIIGADLKNDLEDLGYIVTGLVESGEKAVRKADKDRPDIILMDIVLNGEMDGIEAAEQIRSYLHIPIIFVTSFLDQERLERAKMTLPFGYVLKPVNPRELKLTIEMALYIVKVDSLRRETEEKLRHSEAYLRSVLAAAPIGIGLVQGRVIQWVSDQLTRILGYSGEELIGSDTRSLYESDEEFERVGALKFEKLERLQIGEIETRWLRKDGVVIDALLRLTPVYPGDKSKGIIFSAQDITERKRDQVALKEREQLFYSVLNNTDNALVALDKDRRLIFYNNEYAKMWDLDPDFLQKRPTIEEIIRKVAEKGLYPQDIVEEIIERRLVLLESHPDKRIIEIPRADGRIIEGYAANMPDNAYILTFRDITDRKRMEEELQRTEKLEALGVLAGGIAHDFNNILAGILGNISLAKMEFEAGISNPKRLDGTEKAALRARDLIRQLLTFSRGGAPITKVASIAEVVKESAQFVLHGSNVRFSFWAAPGVWPVEIDEGQISQVINNVMINANQAMPDGGVIEARLENVLASEEIPHLPWKQGNYVKISIKDQGEGIPPTVLTKIFDPFFSTKQTGSGLGLSTAYSIIQKHEGFITVDSEPGEGSVFHVYLPASAKPPKTPKKERNDHHKIGGRILLMDDDPTVLEVAKGMLETIGFEVTMCFDGREALERYEESMNNGTKFDLVIMDLTIPGGMGGKDAIRSLRDMDPDVRALVSSGYSNDSVMSNPRRHGFDGTIAKPYTMDQLRREIAKVIGPAAESRAPA